MKTIIYFFVLLALLALVFCLGSVGGYEAGLLSLGDFLGYSGGSVAVMWAACIAIDKTITSGERKKEQLQEGRK